MNLFHSYTAKFLMRMRVHEVEQRVLWQGKIKGYAISVRAV